MRDDQRICLQCGELVQRRVAAAERLEAVPAGVPSFFAFEGRPPAEVTFGAGRPQRLLAFIIDALIVAGAGWVASLPFGGQAVTISDEGVVEGFEIWLFLPTFIFQCAYYILFAASAWQATPGKRVLGMKITSVDEGRITIIRSVVRFASQQVSLVVAVPLAMFVSDWSPWALVPFASLLAVPIALWILCDNGRSPWDWAAGTKVVD
jgi:uncharacterized RDD family membrane protein YckC